MSKLAVTIDGQTFTVEVRAHPSDPTLYTVVVDGKEMSVSVPAQNDPTHLEWLVVDNRPYELVLANDMSWIRSSSGMHPLTIAAMDSTVSRPVSGDGRVKAPIPGLVTRVMAQAEKAVNVGEPLLILEAMKMGNEIRAPRSGVVKQIHVQPGKTVLLGEVMVEIA